jgi:hypothetical protein
MLRLRFIFSLGVMILLAATLGHAQTSVAAAYIQGRVDELPEKKPGKLEVSHADDLQFLWNDQIWKVHYSEIKTIYVALSRRSALVEVFGLEGAAIGAAKKRKLLLSFVLADRPGGLRNCVFFLPAGATLEFMKALESKTGRTVVYESEEARRAAQGR